MVSFAPRGDEVSESWSAGNDGISGLGTGVTSGVDGKLVLSPFDGYLLESVTAIGEMAPLLPLSATVPCSLRGFESVERPQPIDRNGVHLQ